MSVETSEQTIQAIWECLSRGVAMAPGLKGYLARRLQDATKDGWVAEGAEEGERDD